MQTLFLSTALLMFVSGFAAGADKPEDKERLSVTSPKVGITVVVNKDNRTLEANNADGKLLWKANAVAAAGKLLGPPVVRHLSLTGVRITAVCGKNTYVDYDLFTGKLLSISAD